MAVKTGLDTLVSEDFARLAGSRIAILANQSSVDSSLRHIVDLMFASENCNVVKLFAPEHGFRGTKQDMEEVSDARDLQYNVPVISLYGNSVRSLYPSREHLEGVDVIVVDLQDVGSRYYTFTQTLAYTMESAARADVRVVVLDRPNPLGGIEIEGAHIKKSCRSFCGYGPIANRHGLTIGEFAKMVFSGFGDGEDAVDAIPCKVEIVPMQGWKREMYFEDTGLPWVLPSPNMPTMETAVVYPGMCLFEATTISEGRGTTRPFELLGAPYIDSDTWIQAVENIDITLEGAALRPCSFIPTNQKFAQKICHGLQIHVTDRNSFKPFRWGLALLHALASSHNDTFSWRLKPYEFIDDIPAPDLLFGSLSLRKNIETGAPLSELMAEIETFEKNYLAKREPLLIYP
jgi:uncharacterized protein YbbC (DUF1343 family)